MIPCKNTKSYVNNPVIYLILYNANSKILFIFSRFLYKEHVKNMWNISILRLNFLKHSNIFNWKRSVWIFTLWSCKSGYTNPNVQYVIQLLLYINIDVCVDIKINFSSIQQKRWCLGHKTEIQCWFLYPHCLYLQMLYSWYWALSPHKYTKF